MVKEVEGGEVVAIRPRGLATALAAAQAELADPIRNKTAKLKGRTEYRYAGLDALLAAVRPVLAAHGVAFVQVLDHVEGQIVLRTRLWIEGGDEVVSLYPLDFGGSHHDRGSEITYARRYSLEAIVGVAATEDDDGAPPQERRNDSARREDPAPQQKHRPASRPPHDSFPADQVGFCAKLIQIGTSFGDVARACEAKGWSTPDHWPQRKRDGLIASFRAGTAWADLGLAKPARRAQDVQVADTRPGRSQIEAAAQWQGWCKAKGIDYQISADAVVGRYGMRPSEMPLDQMRAAWGWVISTEGVRARTVAAEARQVLLEKVRGFTTQERAEAAANAEITDGQGRPKTAPSSMRTPELKALVEALTSEVAS